MQLLLSAIKDQVNIPSLLMAFFAGFAAFKIKKEKGGNDTAVHGFIYFFNCVHCLSARIPGEKIGSSVCPV